jgi:small subunit ribosomal protein S21
MWSSLVVVFLALLSTAAAFSTRAFGRQLTSSVRTSALSAVKLTISDPEEPIENVIKRFKRAVNQSGHLMELRHRELWETAADKRKRKAERARQLNRIERTNDKFERRNEGASEYNS